MSLTDSQILELPFVFKCNMLRPKCFLLKLVLSLKDILVKKIKSGVDTATCVPNILYIFSKYITLKKNLCVWSDFLALMHFLRVSVY